MAEPAPSARPQDADPAGWTRTQIALCLGITGLALVLRLCRIEQWSWSAGEATTFRLLTAPLGGPDGLFRGAQGWSPLGYLGLRGLTGLGVLPMHGEGWLRLPCGFVGGLLAPLLVLVGRPLLGAAGALLAGLLVAVHPLLLATSQTADPVGFALLLALAALGGWANGWRKVAVVGFVLAGLCAPFAWLFAGVVLAARLPERAQRAGWGAVAVVVALGLPWWLPAVTWPLALAAVVGAVWQPQPIVRALTLVPLAAAVLATWLGDRQDLLAFAGVVPGAAASAAAGLVGLFSSARATLAAQGRAGLVGAALPTLVVLVWLAVDGFLYLTVYRGGRTPWRQAADAVWVAANQRGGLVVGAEAGAPSLTCYLRPRHWQSRTHDPHPGIAVLPLDLGAAAPFAALAERQEGAVLLVLRQDELERLPAAVAQQLGADFELLRIVPSPQAHGDDTLSIYRRARSR